MRLGWGQVNTLQQTLDELAGFPLVAERESIEVTS